MDVGERIYYAVYDYVYREWRLHYGHVISIGKQNVAVLAYNEVIFLNFTTTPCSSYENAIAEFVKYKNDERRLKEHIGHVEVPLGGNLDELGTEHPK